MWGGDQPSKPIIRKFLEKRKQNMTAPPLFCALHMAYCKGEGKVKSQNLLKIRTFNFAINGFYSFKISEVLYHKRYFDVWGAE